MSRAQGGSLLVAGYECWPSSPVGTYTIASENFGLGDPTALTRAIEQVSLDGERITGRRHSNRLLKLLIVIRANTRQGLDLASGQLETATNQDTWQVQWTPPHLASESALPVIYEAYRAVTTIEYDVEALDPSYVDGAPFVRAIYIEAPAYPFGKSPASVTLSGTSAILSLDTFEDAASGTAWQSNSNPLTHSTWAADGTDKTQGTQSWSAAETFTATVGDTIFCSRAAHALTGGPINLTAYATLSLDIRYIGEGQATARFNLQLIDANGVAAVIALPMPSGGAWTTVDATLSSFAVGPAFDWTKVVSWKFITDSIQVTAGFTAPTIKLDNLRAFPANSVAVTVTNGGVFKFAGVAGTARTNAALVAHAVTTFGSLVAHAAPAEARPDYTPLVPLLATTAPPYTVSMPNYQGAATGQRYDGTYAIWLGGVTLNGSGARTITVVITETVSIGSVTISRSITPATDVHNGLLFLGIANLPLRGAPDGTTDLSNDSAGISLTATIDSGNTADRFSDLLVLDVRGPTVIVTDGGSSASIAVDEPLATSGVGEVYRTSTDAGPTYFIACPDVALISGGPFTLEPGDNLVVFYSPQGAPTVAATFRPRWLSTRSV